MVGNTNHSHLTWCEGVVYMTEDEECPRRFKKQDELIYLWETLQTKPKEEEGT